MQFAVLGFWIVATLGAHRLRWRGYSALLCALLPLSMSTQLALLWLDGALSVRSAAPLHLCAFSGLLCVPMLLTRSRALLAWMLFLGAPCALLALAFPAVVTCTRPVLMQLAFFQLHALILCAALWRLLQGEALPTDPRGTFFWLNAYTVAVSAFNRAFETNYLFLRLAPAGTPLAWLASRGEYSYLLALELCAMLLLNVLASAYRGVQKAREARWPSALRCELCHTPLTPGKK